uniref:Interferon-induced protein with tetratricopeptide repeats 9 n=1 Tax=Erpetoichthys calabaricus TaxID=27687 RepID=A0A8C4X4A3_ERPCA
MSLGLGLPNLQTKLDKLECHFTWGFVKDEMDQLHYNYKKLQDRVNFCKNQYKATYLNILAFVSYLKGDNEGALKFVKEAEVVTRIEYPSKEVNLLVTYGNYAWIFYKMGCFSDVESYLDKIEGICRSLPDATQFSTEIPVIYGEKAWALLKLGFKYYEDSQKCFQKALHGDPDNPSFNFGYAVVLYRLEEHRSPQIELELSDAVKSLVLLALKLQKFGKEESISLIEEALCISPDVPHVTRYVAKYFRVEGYVEKSLDILQKALEMTPSSAFLHHHIGLCYKRQHAELQRNRNPKHCRYSAITMDKASNCIDHFEKAAKLQPSNILFQVSLAEIYGDIHKFHKAEMIYSDLLKAKAASDSDLQLCHFSYALFLLYKKKNEHAAIDHLITTYTIPCQTPKRQKAGAKLKQIAERRLEKNKTDRAAYDILAFIHKEDGEQQHWVYKSALHRASVHCRAHLHTHAHSLREDQFDFP